MTKSIRSRSTIGGEPWQERFSRWWRETLKPEEVAGKAETPRTKTPFMFWDLSDG